MPQIASPPSPPLANGAGTRGWIGAEVEPVTPDLADNMGLNAAAGAFVVRQETDSPAVKAGIESGDVVTAVNNEPVRDARQLALLIGSMAPGTTVTLDLIHDGQQRTVSLALEAFGRRPPAQAAASRWGRHPKPH